MAECSPGMVQPIPPSRTLGLSPHRSSFHHRKPKKWQKGWALGPDLAFHWLLGLGQADERVFFENIVMTEPTSVKTDQGYSLLLQVPDGGFVTW